MNHGHLPDQWAFSKETAFRIPQLMSELQDDILWQRMGCISNAKCRFIRRVLTGNAEQGHLDKYQCPEAFAAAYKGPRMLFEFTFSDKLEGLHAKHGKSEFVASKFHSPILKLQEHIQKPSSDWHRILDTLKDSHRLEQSLAARLKSFASETYESGDDREKLRWLSELYALYAHCSHVGFVPKHLTEIHFASPDDFVDGRKQALAYLVKTKRVKGSASHLIEGLLTVALDGSVTPAVATDHSIDQSPGRFILKLQDHGEEAPESISAKSISDLFWILYPLFNDYERKKSFHQIFIPVYERDSFTNVENPKRRSLSVAGTFLGWFCCDFGSDAPEVFFKNNRQRQQWLFDHKGARCLTRRAQRDLVNLRVLLNQFSERYLEGEKEWALERPMGSAATVEEFVSENVHHCGGWFGKPGEFARPDGFFVFRAGSQFVNKENYGPKPGQLSAKDIDELWIDLTTKPDWEQAEAGNPAGVVLKRRAETALPSNFDALRDYGRSVAKSVRDFYDRARLLEFQQEEGRRDVWDDFSHEVKQLAGALSSTWLLDPSDKLKRIAVEEFNLRGITVGPSFKIIPIPELLTNAGLVIKLWARLRDPLEMFTDGNPKCLKEVITRCWVIARNSMKAVVCKKARMDLPSSYAEAIQILAAVDAAFPTEIVNVTSAESCFPVPLPGEYQRDRHLSDKTKHELDKWWLGLMRVLAAKFKDVLRHADPDRENSISVNLDGSCLAISIMNWTRKSDPKDASLRQFLNILGQSRMMQSEGIGGRLVAEELRRLNGHVVTTPQGEPYHWQAIVPLIKYVK